VSRASFAASQASEACFCQAIIVGRFVTCLI
jgi:hypothetical protein